MLATMIIGLPWWLSGEESICNGGDMVSIPRMGKSPRRGNGHSCILAWETPRTEEPGELPFMVLQELDMTEGLNNNIMITRRKLIFK